MTILLKTCKICSSKFQPKYSTLENTCSIECKIALFKTNSDKKIKQKFKPIPKVSKKRIVENLQYQVLRKEFLEKEENKICKISNEPTTEIHHTYSGKDRARYYLDTTTWLAVSRSAHNWIHDNPKESREMGYLM